jgi:short-subunit dehydrogenase
MNIKTYKAVLTGATGGIGQAIAHQLAPHCEQLILLGRDQAKLEALQKVLSATVPKVQILVGDISDAQVHQELQALAQSIGGVNLLINNAGTSQFKSFTNQSSEEIQGLLNTNLVAPILLTKSLITSMIGQEKAQIINIGSIFGYLGFPGFTSYCASKFGLRGFSQSLRRELSDTNIAVRYFAPRATRTNINSDAVTQMNQELKTTSDTTEFVASELMKFLKTDSFEKKLGVKESFFVFMNQLFPGIPDKAILGQLPIIKKYLNK